MQYVNLRCYSVDPTGCIKVKWHTAYSRNNMCQKCGGDCGLWVLIDITRKIYPENMKKIVGALWELPAK